MQLIPTRIRPTRSSDAVLLGLLIAVVGIPTFILPLGTDQNYFLLGARTILDGDRLYRDLWDIKPPAIYALYVPPLLVPGADHLSAIRAWDLLNTAIAAWAIYLLAERSFGGRAGLFAGALYIFFYLTAAGVDGLAQAEGFAVAPIAFCFVLYKVEDVPRPKSRFLAAGIILGLAVASKPTAILLFAGFIVQELVNRAPEARLLRAPAAWRLLAAGIGVFLVQLSWLAYLLAFGALNSFVDIAQHFTRPYQEYRWAPEGISYSRIVITATATWLQGAAIVSLPAWLGISWAVLRGYRREALFFAAISCLGILAVWWQGKFFQYHWIVMLPLLAPPAGFAFDEVAKLIGSKSLSERVLLSGLAAAAILVAAMSPLYALKDGYDVFLDRLTGGVNQAEINSRHIPELTLIKQMTEYVEENSEKSEGFYAWGFWTVPYVDLDREVPTRFVTNAGLRAAWAPESWRNELLIDLREKVPRFIAVFAGDWQPWLVGTDEASDEAFCEFFPGLRSFVESNYRPVLNNGLVVLYDRDAPAPLVPGRCAYLGD